MKTDDSVRTGFVPGHEGFPRLIEPAGEMDLAAWVRVNAPALLGEVHQYGAVLLRGFEIHTPDRFEAVASGLCSDLFNENGEHPRETVSGKVYTTVFFPHEEQLLWHNENSFNHGWPTKIMFCCAQPADKGGETPIVDSRMVYQKLDPSIRRRFEEKGVMYQRNYGDGLGLDWPTVFSTHDRAEVEAQCARGRFTAEWKEGNRLRTLCVRPAAIRHPVTGEMCWFNQAQHWHPSCLHPEVREALTELFSQEEMPRNCFYGDGSLIEDPVMREILGVYRSLEVALPWHRGDIMIVDNVLAAHGRNAYEGKRTMLVSMGEMRTYDEV